MSTIRRRYLVLGTMLGGIAMQLTILACGSIRGVHSDSGLEDGEVHADSLPAPMAMWSSYTPTFTIDGTKPSQLVRGSTIRFVTFDKTVCLQGLVILGEQAAGSSGTSIKLSVPPGHPGATGVKQYGIGSVIRTGDTTTPFPGGAGAIEDDVNNFIFVKNASAYYTSADARLGAAVIWVASGCYESI
jgi:hypothetical protein